jgi:hypothetical protein
MIRTRPAYNDTDLSHYLELLPDKRLAQRGLVAELAPIWAPRVAPGRGDSITACGDILFTYTKG